jgi:hypothetical protein
VVNFRPCPIYPRKNSGAHRIGGYVGSIDTVDVLEKIKGSFPFRDSNPDCPASSKIGGETIFINFHREIQGCLLKDTLLV